MLLLECFFWNKFKLDEQVVEQTVDVEIHFRSVGKDRSWMM